MYQAPTLQRFGTLRELTLGGGSFSVDMFGPTSDGNSGCTPGTGGAWCANS